MFIDKGVAMEAIYVYPEGIFVASPILIKKEMDPQQPTYEFSFFVSRKK